MFTICLRDCNSALRIYQASKLKLTTTHVRRRSGDIANPSIRVIISIRLHSQIPHLESWRIEHRHFEAHTDGSNLLPHRSRMCSREWDLRSQSMFRFTLKFFYHPRDFPCFGVITGGLALGLGQLGRHAGSLLRHGHLTVIIRITVIIKDHRVIRDMYVSWLLIITKKIGVCWKILKWKNLGKICKHKIMWWYLHTVTTTGPP